MFCPRCGAENSLSQGFCRQCGMSLAAVRLASAGRFDEALAKLDKGSGNITTGAVVFAVGLVNAAINNILFDAWLPAYICVIAGSAVGAPLFAVGLSRVKRARRILNGEDETKPRADTKSLEGEARDTALLPEADADVFDAAGLAARDSVTDHTTLKLHPRGPAGRR